MPLTDTQVRQAKAGEKPRKIADGGGLHIFITIAGSKLWRLNYRYDGKQKLLSFGAYPAVTLAQAREKREAVKAILAKGIDPAAKRKADKEADAAVTRDTFENIAAELIEKRSAEGLAETTLKKKAWSQNLGHAGLLTTLTSYGKLSLDEQGREVRRMTQKPDGDDAPLTMAALEAFMKRNEVK